MQPKTSVGLIRLARSSHRSKRLRIVKDLGLDAALDFHGRLHKPMAKQLAKALEPYNPLWIEEPLLSEHPEGIKQLSRLTTCPIALGERLYNRWDVKRFLQDASVDVLQPDISHVGGISEIKKIASMAEAFDVAIAPHCPLGPIAFAASIQVAVSTPNFVIQEMSLGIHYNTEAGEYDLTNYLKDRERLRCQGRICPSTDGRGPRHRDGRGRDPTGGAHGQALGTQAIPWPRWRNPRVVMVGP